MLLVALPSGAQAEERSFCWGANVAPGMGGCASGNWWMNAAYANSTEGPVCIGLEAPELAIVCDHNANEGVYRNQGFCGYGRAIEYNPSTHYERIYGKFWTC